MSRCDDRAQKDIKSNLNGRNFFCFTNEFFSSLSLRRPCRRRCRLFQNAIVALAIRDFVCFYRNRVSFSVDNGVFQIGAFVFSFFFLLFFNFCYSTQSKEIKIPSVIVVLLFRHFSLCSSTQSRVSCDKGTEKNARQLNGYSSIGRELKKKKRPREIAHTYSTKRKSFKQL